MKDLAKALEPIIRRVIREELLRMASSQPGMFQLKPGMPLYSDMEDLRQRKKEGKIKLHLHDEVWGE